MVKIDGAQVLFNFWPELPVNWSEPLTVEDEWELVRQFCPQLSKLGYDNTTYYTARSPLYNRTNMGAHMWHRDGERPGALVCLWASNGTPEVRDAHGNMLDAQDGDVILLKDYLVVHRAQVKPSWFVRIGVRLIRQDDRVDG